jgi:hypothetical protein
MHALLKRLCSYILGATGRHDIRTVAGWRMRARALHPNPGHNIIRTGYELCACFPVCVSALHRGCDWVGESALLSCLEHTPLLERLNVSCCDELGDRVLRALPQLCPKLTLLDVCYCSEMSVAGR